MLYKGVNRGSHFLIAVWILLSFLILVCNGFFWINDYISSPQHGLFEHFNEVSEVIRFKNLFWYRLYFLLDFFWGLYLLLIIGDLVKDDQGISLLNYREYSTSAAKPYLFFAGLALFIRLYRRYLLFVLLGH